MDSAIHEFPDCVPLSEGAADRLARIGRLVEILFRTGSLPTVPPASLNGPIDESMDGTADGDGFLPAPPVLTCPCYEAARELGIDLQPGVVVNRWFAEQWDTLVAVTDPSERCTFNIPVAVKPTSQELVRTVVKLEEQVQEAVMYIQQLVHENPEMVPWGAKLVSGLWNAANHCRQSYGRTQITLRHQARLEKLGKPDPVGVEVGEPTRPIEPPQRVDAEVAAWMAENPADAILPPSGPEDFVFKHCDGTVTRLRDLAPAYEAGLIDRPWAPITSNWELDLIHDLVLVRASADNVYRVSDVHLNWWLKPLKALVKTLDPDALLLTAKAQLASMMSAQPMLVTSLGNERGGGWMLTHAGRGIVEEKLLPQWPTFNGNGGGQ